MSESEPVVDPSQLLSSAATLPLAGWYAQPLTAAAAAALQAEAARQVQSILTEGTAPASTRLPAARLAELIAGFWLNRAVALDYRSLIATYPPQSSALIELVYGQLLISCKLKGAFDHLARGFALAVPRLAPADYFVLLRRHELLRALSLHEQPSPAQTLADLLTEARVIRRLQPAGRPGGGKHDDTTG